MSFARVAMLAALCCVGCTKKAPTPRRTAPWLAIASASSGTKANDAPLSFHFTPDSRITFTLPGKRGKVSGQVPLASGTLQLDPRDLKNANAHIDVDLTELSIDEQPVPADVELGSSTASALAQQWLELGPAVAPERRNELSRARFELTSLDSVSPPGLDFGVRGRDRVRASLVGTLLMHGFRAPVRVDVLLSAIESPPVAPRRLSIRSAGALVLPLAPHDIMARDPSGRPDPRAMARASPWLGKSAHIEFALVAEADASAAK